MTGLREPALRASHPARYLRGRSANTFAFMAMLAPPCRHAAGAGASMKRARMPPPRSCFARAAVARRCFAFRYERPIRKASGQVTNLTSFASPQCCPNAFANASSGFFPVALKTQPSNPEVLFRVRASRGKTHANITKRIMTTLKTILIDDWYAPTFRVRITDASKCSATPRNPCAGYAPLFRTTHPEPWRPSHFHQQRRRSRFAALSRT